MSPTTFTKKVKNDQFVFEGRSENGREFFSVRPNRLGRPFIMAKLDRNKWVIPPDQAVEPEIKELENLFAEIIKQISKG